MLEVWVTDLDAGETLSVKMQVPPEYAETMRWLADVKAPFSAGELQDRFPAPAFEQHCKVLDVLARAKYLRVLWFPRLPRD